MLTITDLFCGSGGSSSGAEQVPGVQVRMAVNHWKLAVDTHQANMPWADHDCEDISKTHPRRYPRTDILWASPSCTHHSRAQGRKRAAQPTLFDPQKKSDEDAAERSRATMWNALEYAEHHQYRAVVIENVVDVREWVMWPAWRHALDCLGYDSRVVYLNSMHAGQFGPAAPQSRDRLYVVCWRRGDRAPDLNRWTRPVAHCPGCDRSAPAIQAWKRPDRQYGVYGRNGQYLWRCPTKGCHQVVHPPVLPAAVTINWSNLGARIGDRTEPLQPATIRRIRAGLARYGTTPALVPAGGTWNDTPSPVTDPMRARTTRETEGLFAPPLLVSYYGNGNTRPVTQPIATIPTKDRFALVGAEAALEDCTFRMLEVDEIRAGMAFPDGYTLLGNAKKDKVRMLGNAVTPPAARDLIAAVVEAITGEDIQTTAA